MRGFFRENQFPTFTVKFSSPFDKLLNIFCAFDDERFDGFHIAQTRARIERVFLVKFGVVVIG